MVTIIFAHFDGKHSLVLDGPVDLPVGTPLRVQIESVHSDVTQSPQRPRLSGALQGQIRLSEHFDEPLEEFKEYM